MLEKLQRIGLSDKESHIYLALVKLGESAANELAKQTSSNRTVTYNILQQLIEKGLVSYIKKLSKRFYFISDPKSLLVDLKEKEILANDLIKEIKKIKKPKEISYKNVEIYEGKEGLKLMFEDIRKAKNLRVLNATGLAFEYLKYSAKHIAKEIESWGKTRVIAVQSLRKTRLAKFKKIKFKYLPKEAENYATTFIFDDKVIIQVLKDEPFLIKIENKEIFDGYAKNFDVLWKRL